MCVHHHRKNKQIMKVSWRLIKTIDQEDDDGAACLIDQDRSLNNFNVPTLNWMCLGNNNNNDTSW